MSKLTGCLPNSKSQRGFVSLMGLFWIAVIGFVLWWGTLIALAHYHNAKAQDLFESVVDNMPSASEAQIRARLPKLFKVMYIDHDDLPQEFYDNILIKADGDFVEISSIYGVVIWPLGPVQAVDQQGDYDPDALQGMDKVREALRMEIEFEPFAASR